MTDSQALERAKPKLVRERPTYDPEQVERVRRSYSDDEKEAAMVAVVRCHGHQPRAVALLASEGIEVPERTLCDWVGNTQVQRLERVRTEWEPRLKVEGAELHYRLFRKAAEIEELAVDKIKEQLEAGKGDLKDLSAVQQRSAISTGIHTEKHLIYSGEPTQIHRLDTGEVLRKLGSRNMRLEATERTVVVESSES